MQWCVSGILRTTFGVTVFIRAKVAPMRKTHPNFCLDFLVSGNFEIIRINLTPMFVPPRFLESICGCGLHTGGYGTQALPW